MRFATALAVFSLFAATSATVAPQLGLVRRQGPACEQDCLAHPNLGNCKASDLTCLCNNNDFVQGTFDCIKAACTGTDLASAIALAAATCQSVGVTLASAAGAEFSATASLNSANPSSGSSTPNSPSASAPAPSNSNTPNGALSSSANTAFLGLAAIGAVALAL